MTAMQTASPSGLNFSVWLRTRPPRNNWTDALANAARTDRTFPGDADPEDVRRHLIDRGADGDAFAQLDDAELDWLAH